jgi:hypothetical protein
MPTTSFHQIQKCPLKQTQSSPIVVRSRKMQSSKDSVKELVDIRFPVKQRSKSSSDLAIRPLSEKEQEILRASSMDSYQAKVIKRKKITSDCEGAKSSIILNRKNNDSTKCQSGFNDNERQDKSALNGTDRHNKLLLTPCNQTSGSENINESVSTPEEDFGDCEVGTSMSELEDPFDEVPYYANLVLRPPCYIYRNVSYPEDAPEIPNTYVNIFSGSSIKGCYENCNILVYEMFNSGMVEQGYTEVPPPTPKPRLPPPRLPPKGKIRNHKENYPPKSSRSIDRTLGCPPDVPERPPKRPPKLTKNLTKSQPNLLLPSHIYTCPDENQTTPRIQVAIFASTPTSGLVWFLRIAFMHQDDDTTFKVLYTVYLNYYLNYQ